MFKNQEHSSKRGMFPVLALMIGVAFLGLTAFVQAAQTSDVSVELTWAAFDEDHAAVEYEIAGNFDVPDGYLPIACPVSEAHLFNAQGDDITGNTFTSCRIVGENKYSVTQFFYNEFQTDLPYRLEVTLGNQVLMPAGNGEVSQTPSLGTFKFEGEFTQLADLTVKPPQDAGNENFSVFVQRVDFAPSLVKVNGCITYPDTRDWGPAANLVIGGQSFPSDEWGMRDYKNPKTFAGPERCYTFLFYTDIPDLTRAENREISFVVDDVHMNFPDCVDAAGLAKISAELEKYGIAPALDSSGYYCFGKDLGNSSTLDNNDKAGIFEYMRQALVESVPGPVEVPLK